MILSLVICPTSATVDGSGSNYFCRAKYIIRRSASHICPVVLQNEKGLHNIICSCQVRIGAAVCHFSEVSRICGFLLDFIQLSM